MLDNQDTTVGIITSEGDGIIYDNRKPGKEYVTSNVFVNLGDFR